MKMLYIYVNMLHIIDEFGLGVRVFANSPDPIPNRVMPKTLKMILNTSLLNTQRFKGKVEQSREWSSALPYTLM